MGAAQRSENLVLTVGGEDGLEPQLEDALLAARFADRWVGPLPAQERPCPDGVPGAALVLADPAGAGVEQGVAYGLQRLARDEDDELAPFHAPIVAVWPVPAQALPSRSSPRERSARRTTASASPRCFRRAASASATWSTGR